MTDLGAAIGEFHTDNGRRVWTALGCLVVGAAALYLGRAGGRLCSAIHRERAVAG